MGTELTIEGTFTGGKNSWILVTKVNGNELVAPQLIASNLEPSAKISTNNICRFKGVETTGIVEDQSSVEDPAGQQAASGRHFCFKVTEVLAADGLIIREKKRPNKPSEATR